MQHLSPVPAHDATSRAHPPRRALLWLWLALALVVPLGWVGQARAAKPGSVAAPTALPAVNLLVELRVIAEARASGHGDYTVSTQGPLRPATEALQLLLANGQSGAVRLGGALPVQWLQGAARGGSPAAAAAPAAPVAPATSTPADRAGAVAYAVTWVPAGQSLLVQPRWAGGDSPVTLELDFSSTTLQPAPGTPLPATRTRQAASTLRVPLGVWTSFAATGVAQDDAEPGRVSTWTLAERGRQLMQVRVTLP